MSHRRVRNNTNPVGRTSKPADSQLSGVKWKREQLFQLMLDPLSLQILGNNLQIATKLPKQLTTSTTRRRWNFTVCNDSNPREALTTFGNGLKKRNSLRAHSES